MADQLRDLLSSQNVNVSNTKPVIKTNVNVAKRIAMELEEKFGDTTSFNFFVKVGINLPENVIWLNYEQAQSKNKPAAYFSTVCKAMMRERGVK